MMNCNELKKWIGTEGAFTDNASEAAERHIAYCEECKTLFTINAHLEDQISSCLEPVEAPARLFSGIEMDLAPEAKERLWQRFQWMKLAPAIAVAILIIIFINPFTSKVTTLKTISHIAINDHISNIPMEFSAGEVQDIPGWFEKRLGYRIGIPDLGDNRIQFVGGRQCLFGECNAAYLKYSKNGNRVSVFIVDTAEVNIDLEESDSVMMEEQGHDVRIWKQQDLLYVMVT